MHKFFYNYNNITEKFELSPARSLMMNRSMAQAENTLLPNIRNLMQELYDTLVLLKEKDAVEDNLTSLDENELLLSNLFYSLFTTPLELSDKKEIDEVKGLYQRAIALASELEKLINIPEYNRTISIIKSNLQNIYNSLS